MEYTYFANAFSASENCKNIYVYSSNGFLKSLFMRVRRAGNRDKVWRQLIKRHLKTAIIFNRSAEEDLKYAHSLTPVYWIVKIYCSVLFMNHDHNICI